ncbi:MAG: RIP metalloprotease RseP [Hyphomicrobiaceae bacterium]|nr:RIP metalloprotease RseP [Hyphomicrobiaceae bacterium]
MDLISTLTGFGSGVLFYVPPFLLLLTIIVFVHELGHFLVARWCNVTVRVFSIGFGPEIFGFYDRKGTRWRFSWIPLGGYVKFLGDESVASTPDHEGMRELSEEERKGAFHLKPLGQRAAVVAAGPIANFLLAIAIFTCMFTFVGQHHTLPIVDKVQPDSAASEAGFEKGDRIISIDGEPIETFSEMRRIVSISGGQRLDMIVDRNGSKITLTPTPRTEETSGPFGKVRRGLLGIHGSDSPEDYFVTKHDPLTSAWLGTKETYFVIARTMVFLYKFAQGQESADQLGGPARIAAVAGQAASLGVIQFVNITAVLSISIGLINLFPIPMLDGGHLLFYSIEAVRGRPLSERSQEIGFRIGLALVLMLMIFVTWNDVIHFTSL